MAFDAVLDQFVESPTGVLIGALESNNFELAEDALLRGADFNVRIAGRPLIFHYVHNGNAGATRFLLDHGADVNSKSNLGRSLLHEAALNGQPEIVTILLEYGADVNGTNPRGDTALFYAEDQKKLGAPMTEGRAEAARILRANGGVK